MKIKRPAKRGVTLFRPAVLVRIVWFGFIWTIFTGGRMESWLLGGPAVLTAAWISVRTRRFQTAGFALAGGFRFVVFFLKASLLSGLDVVRRALHPRLLLQPDLIDYRLSLSTDAARVFMADTVSLLPGTLSAHLVGETLTIHVLDRNAPIREELTALEERVAAMLEADIRSVRAIEGDV